MVGNKGNDSPNGGSSRQEGAKEVETVNMNNSGNCWENKQRIGVLAKRAVSLGHTMGPIPQRGKTYWGGVGSLWSVRGYLRHSRKVAAEEQAVVTYVGTEAFWLVIWGQDMSILSGLHSY